MAEKKTTTKKTTTKTSSKETSKKTAAKVKSEDQYKTDRANLISKISKLQSMMSKSYYATWVDFSVGDFRLVQTSDRIKNSMVSFDYERTGTEKANTFTIVAAFAPNPNNLDETTKIEKQIGYEKVKDGQHCKLRYGYIQGDKSIMSPEYEGILTNYKIEIRDGILYYTFTGTSDVVAMKEQKVNTESYIDKRPTEAVKEELEKSFQVNPAMKGWKVVIDKTVEDHPDGTADEIAGGEFSNIFQYAKDVLAQAKAPEGSDDGTETQIAPPATGKANSYGKSDKKVEKTEEKKKDKKEEKKEDHGTYGYVVSDSKKEVRIIRYDSTDKKTIPKADIKFNWMSQDGIVQDFRTEFDGALLVNKTFLEQTEEDENKDKAKKITEALKDSSTWPFSNLGKAMYNAMKDNEAFASQGAELINDDRWKKATDKSYSATMTTVGMPFEEITIGTTMFKIVPLIYGRAHFTQGDYMVTGIRDIVDANGYSTTFQLMRVGEQDGKK